MNSQPFNQARYAPLMAITDQAAADTAFNQLVEETMAAEHIDRAKAEAKERNNLAVFAALNSPADFPRVEQLFKTAHEFYRTKRREPDGTPAAP